LQPFIFAGISQMQVKKKGKSLTFTTPVTVRLSAEQQAAFAKIANKLDVTVTELMRQAIVNFLQSQEHPHARRKSNA
jgi:hypothetical protein